MMSEWLLNLRGPEYRVNFIPRQHRFLAVPVIKTSHTFQYAAACSGYDGFMVLVTDKK